MISRYHIISSLFLGAVLALSGCSLSPTKPDPKPIQLQIVDPKSQNYEIDEVFENLINNGGMSVKTIMDDQSIVDLKREEFTYEIYDSNNKFFSGTMAFEKSGNYKVKVSKGNTLTINHNIVVNDKVSQKVLTGITLFDYTKTIYVGDEYNFDGKVKATYSDGTSAIVTDKAEATIPKITEAGIYQVLVSYTENKVVKTATFDLTVKEKASERILESITTSGEKTTFDLGDTFTFGGTVTAHYSDGSSDDVTNEADIEEPDMSMAGEEVVYVRYEGKVTYYTITINPKSVVLNEITISGQKTTFNVGDTFTFGGTVTAHYSNGTTSDVTSQATFTGYNLSNKGTQTVTVSYQGKIKTYEITVTENTPVIETISVEEAVNIINNLDENEVSSKEYYVRGVTSNVEKDNNGFNGGFLNSNLKFRSVKGNGVASDVDEINGKEVVIYGYLENYNSIYQIPYLPAYASPTGSKYNAKLIEVKSGGEEEIIDVTNVSISPVNKTLEVGKTATLLATVLPQNATNKSLTWKSSDQGVCEVSNNGEIRAVSVGNAVITVTSNNGITATSNITVTKQEDTPVEGDKYTISFNKFESDGQTELTSSTIMEQITSGSSYISSIDSLSKIYKGMKGLKFGSTRNDGSLEFTVSNSISNLDCKEVILDVAVYGTTSKTVSLSVNDNDPISGSSSDGNIVAKFNSPVKLNTISILSSGRAYISGITFVCGESTPIPVTAISIPSSKAISTGNSDTLQVTYSPSNANTEKSITWSSNNTSVATVSNGVVTGIKAGTAEITATSEKGLTSKCSVTVSDVSVTGVTLSSNSETISICNTKQLTATVSPSNATNKKVTWNSSNLGVATVNESGLVTALAVGSSKITVQTADGNKSAICTITVTEVKKDAWTIMIYMCGADLESESGLATGDIKEILSVSNQPDDVNIVIETGGAKSWSLSSSYIQGAKKIDSSKLSRWHVANKKLVFDESLTYASMGNSATLQSFVEYGIKEYPAEKTGVILWNHGGAMYGCCYDEKKEDDSLLNSEMKSAFSKALSNTGTSKLEFVGYDTCLTQVQDIAEFNSNYFNYMIASEESEAGEGWDYDTWIDDVYSHQTTDTILKAVVDGFIIDNGGASSRSSDQTLSYLDLSQMAAYKTAFESFASALKSQLSSKSVTKKTFASWMDQNVKAFAVDADSSETYFCLFDVKDMLNKISNNSTYNPGASYISAVNTAFSNLVKYSVAQKGAGNAYGLGCIYSQGSSDAKYIKQVYTSTETNFSNWLSFLKSYSYLG